MKKPDLPPALSCLLPLHRFVLLPSDSSGSCVSLSNFSYSGIYHEQLVCGHRAEVGVVDHKWMQIVTDTFKQG